MTSGDKDTRNRWGALRAPLVYVGVAALATFPLVLQLGSALLGDPQGDVCTHVWTMAWARHELLHAGELIFDWTDAIAFPGGGAVVGPTPLNELASIPLQALFGVVAAYNLVVVANLVLAAWAAYALAVVVIGDRRAALVAGLIYGFGPFVLTYAVASGGSELVSIGWIPLALLLLLRTAREPGWRWPLLAGLAVAAVELSCLYHLAVVALAGAAVVGWQLTAGRARRGDLVADAGGGAGRPQAPDRRLALRLGAAVAVAAALALPHALQLRAALASPDSILRMDLGERDAPVVDGADPSPLTHNRAYDAVTLVNLVRPGRAGQQRSEHVCRFQLTPYVGYSVLALAAAGLVWTRRRRALAFVAGGGAAAAIVATGPFLQLGDRLALASPSSPLHRALGPLPFYAEHHDAAFHHLTVLALALLAAAGVAGLTRRFALPRRTPWVLAAVVIADLWLVSGGAFPVPQDRVELPRCYVEHVPEAPRMGVLELPFQRGETQLALRERFCFQVSHGQPIAETLPGFVPPYCEDNAFTRELLRIERLPPDAGGEPQGAVDEGLQRLVDDGFGRVVVDIEAFPPGGWAHTEPFLERHLGRLGEVDGCRVYALPEPRGGRRAEGGAAAGAAVEPAPPRAADDHRADDALAHADALFNSGALDDAERAYRALLDDPSRAAVRGEVARRLAKIAFLRGDVDGAIVILEQHLAGDDDNSLDRADLTYELGKAYLRRGRHDEARARFAEIVERWGEAAPTRWGVYWARLRLAALAARRGDPDGARAAYAALLDDAAFWTRLEREAAAFDVFYVRSFIAQDLRALGDAERSAAVLEPLVDRYEIPETRLLARVELAQSYQALGRREDAERLYRELFDVDAYRRHRDRLAYLDLVGFVEPGFREEAWVDAIVAAFEHDVAALDVGDAPGATRLRITAPRPGDGFEPG